MLSHQQTTDLLDAIGRAVDIVGVIVIVLGLLVAAASAVTAARVPRCGRTPYVAYRQSLGRAILLGLEILVAADIISTVAVSPTFTSIGVLALIVLVRTFLSVALELEITGRWPWQRSREEQGP